MTPRVRSRWLILGVAAGVGTVWLTMGDQVSTREYAIRAIAAVLLILVAWAYTERRR
jgi:hypothetical protein